MEHLIEHAGHVAMNTLLWEAAVVLWVIGMMDLGVSKRHDVKDFGYILLTAAIMETIAMMFVIASGNIFGATAAAAFVFLLWALAFGLLNGTNRVVTYHAVLLTSFYFTGATIYLASKGALFLTAMFGLLVPITLLLALASYTEKHSLGRIAGGFSAIDGILFFIYSLCSAIGYQLP
ncbi:hypothetical protein [Desulfurella sp.]|uniref:hypothetical protein n=1 Tax=Desulfurella sp. TaxID=1962857 RepID=UPI003D0F6691